MRVVTLLPAATEIVAALRGAGQLVGIARVRLPRLDTAPSAGPGDARRCDAPGKVVDAEVRRLRSSGRPVGLCEVCAVSDGEVQRLTAGFAWQPVVC